MVATKGATGLYSSASEVVREVLHLMNKKDRFNRMKLDQLRNDIQAGVASGDAGTLDAGEIKRRVNAWHRAALRETERRYETRKEEPIDRAAAKQELHQRC